MTWLVVGGAGYIGAHVVRRLRAEDRAVAVLDDLSTGVRERVPADVPLIVADAADPSAVRQALRLHKITGVIYLAARKSAPESVAHPLRYYQENVEGMRVLLDEMVRAGVANFLLSSTAAVYGIPRDSLVTEETPTVPINPYGETKLLCEWLLRSVGAAHRVNWIALRYFNVVGAEDALLADRGRSSLFPLVFQEALAGRPAPVTGTDFPTRDGTGVRDYVHVADIADAHAVAIHRLEREPAAEIYNVGTGRGYTVLEVVDAIRHETGIPIEINALPRRPGDPPEVIASVEKIARDLAWKARYDLIDMVRSTWATWPTHANA